MKDKMVKIKKPESCRGCPVSDHNHICKGDAVMTDSISTKICSKCKVEKPVSEFYKNKRCKDGLRCDCKTCVTKYRIENRDIINLIKKRYYNNNKKEILKKQKLYNKINKDTIRKKNKERRENNKEKIAKSNKKYRESNKKKIAKINKEYRKNNKEKIAKTLKEYRKNNKDKIENYRKINKIKIAKQTNKYYEKNKERLSDYRKTYRKSENGRKAKLKSNHKYRVLKLKVTIEDFNPFEVFERDNYICQLCRCKTSRRYKNKSHPKYTNLDHIVPLSLGGAHSKQNTQCLCFRCNTKKRNAGFGDQLRLF